MIINFKRANIGFVVFVLSALFITQGSFASLRKANVLERVNNQIGANFSIKKFEYDNGKYMSSKGIPFGVDLFFNKDFRTRFYLSGTGGVYYAKGKFEHATAGLIDALSVVPSTTSSSSSSSSSSASDDKSSKSKEIKLDTTKISSSSKGSVMLDLDLKIGYVLDMDYNAQLVPNFSIALKGHQQGIGSEGVKEMMTRTLSYTFGFLYSLPITDVFVVTPEINMGSLVGNEGFTGIKEYKDCGGFVDMCGLYDLSGQFYGTVGVRGNYFINRLFSVNAVLQYKYYDFKKSKIKNHDKYIIRLPTRTNSEFKIGAGMSLHF